MNNTLSHPTINPILAFTVVLALAGSTASAMDNDLRIVPQILAGTAGVEPGVALEWRGLDKAVLILRPEIFLSEDGDLGAGAAVLYDVSNNLDLPERQAMAIGPRVVYHNSDQYSWEADVMATWSFDLKGDSRAWTHAVGLIGAVGVVHDKDDDDNEPGASVGLFYSFGF